MSQVRNVVTSWGAFGLSAAAGLFLSPFVVHRLGTSGFGIWVLIGSLTGTLNIFDLGMRSAVTRFVARDHARGDHESASRIVGTVRVLFLAAGGIVLLAALVLAIGFGRWWFDVPAEFVASARLVLLLSATSLAVVLSNGLHAGVLAGIQRLDVLGLTDVMVEAMRIVLVLGVLSAGGGLVGLALIGLLQSLVRRAVLQRRARQLYPELRSALRRPRRDDVRAILAVSAWSTLIYSSVAAIAQATSLIIAAFLPLSAVAYYAIGSTLPTYGHALNRPIAQTVHPRASRLEALGDADGLRALILTTGRYSALVLLPLVITFVVRGATFIGIWMGDDYRGPAGDVLAVLGTGLLFAGTRHVMQAAFVGAGKHRSLGAWYLAEAIVIVLATVVAVPRWGILGAAWGAVAPSMLLSTVGFPWLCRRHFGVPMPQVWRRFWIQPLVAMLPFTLASLAVDRGWAASSYVAFFGQVALLMPLALLGAAFVGLDRDERQRLVAPVMARLGRRDAGARP